MKLPMFIVAMAIFGLMPGASNAATPPPGGANQRPSVEGCIGETLFNGVWRLLVTDSALKVNPDDPDYKSWAITLELRNGKNAQDSPGDSGFQDYPQIAFVDGAVLDMQTDEEVQYQKAIFYKSFPPGGVAQMTMYYRLEGDNATKTPTKLLVNIKRTEFGKTFGYTVADPSFRVKLDCKS
jgi:hypothetical protein